MVFRRKRHATTDPELARARAAFDAVAVALDRAQRALLLAIPTARHPGAALGEALDAFENGLDEVERLMPSWRTSATEQSWQTCNASLHTARAEAQRLRVSPPAPTEFELLNARVGDVLEPLEDFAETERALRRHA